MSLNRRNYYRMLYVQPDAPLPVIKAAYRTLAITEARTMGSASALLTEAYTVLSDPVLRAAYDAKTTVRSRHSPMPDAVRPTAAPTAAPAAVGPTEAPSTPAPSRPFVATGPSARRPGTGPFPPPAAPPAPAPAAPAPAAPAARDAAAGSAHTGGPATPSIPWPGAVRGAAKEHAPAAPAPAAPAPAAAAPAPAAAAPAAAAPAATVPPPAAAKGHQPATPEAAQAAAVACPMCQSPRAGRITADTRCAQCSAPLAAVARPARPRAAAGNERRFIPRVGRSDWATLQAPWNAEPVRVRLRDLSADGISVYSSTRVAPGTRVRIGNERFDLVATVVACRTVKHVYSLHARLETAWVAPKAAAAS